MEENFELKGENNPKIVSSDGEIIKYAHGKKDLSDIDTFEYFIKACEKQVRNDPRYDNFIANLKRQGYTKDVFQAGIDSERFPKTPLEVHHGPIYNLFDICSIVTDSMLADGEKVTTFSVANEVLKAHEKGLVQVVACLTETNHQLVHNGKMFVHITQAVGDLMGFLKKYKNGLKRDNLYALEQYLKLCMENDATDNDYLLVREAGRKITEYLNK